MKKRWSIDPNTKQILKQIGIGILVFSTVALLLTGVWYGTRLADMTITEVEIEGGETIDHDRVRKLVEFELDGEYLNFIPRRFAWLYPKKDIIESVSSLERLHSIEIERVNGTKIHLSFKEYLPTALWCDSEEEKNCMFISQEALAYTNAPQLTGGSLIRFSFIGEKPERSKTLTDIDTFNKLLELVGSLDEYSWHVSTIELDSAGDAYLQIVEGGELKINTSDDPAGVLENFLVILASDDFDHLEPGNFQYIDLRFGSKVFVKEREVEQEIEKAASTSEAVENNGGE